eukprot:7020662-Prymnesium_polylepis.2
MAADREHRVAAGVEGEELRRREAWVVHAAHPPGEVGEREVLEAPLRARVRGDLCLAQARLCRDVQDGADAAPEQRLPVPRPATRQDRLAGANPKHAGDDEVGERRLALGDERLGPVVVAILEHKLVSPPGRQLQRRRLDAAIGVLATHAAKDGDGVFRLRRLRLSIGEEAAWRRRHARVHEGERRRPEDVLALAALGREQREVGADGLDAG